MERPSFKGLIVDDERTKRHLLKYLAGKRLIEDGKILGVAVDRFIRVGTRVNEELIS